METSSIARLSTDLAATRTEAAVATAVLRKALDIEAQGALALLDALPSTSAANNPPHLGQHVDTFA